MANDNIDGHLLAEMILEQLEEAIKGRGRAEHDAADQRSKVWGLEQEIKRLTEERNTYRADCARAERELEAIKGQIASLSDSTEAVF